MNDRQIIIEAITVANLIPFNGNIPNFELDISNGTPFEIVWSEMVKSFPQVAAYVDSIEESEIAKSMFSNSKNLQITPIELRVQNFIRCLRIRNNIRLVALIVRGYQIALSFRLSPSSQKNKYLPSPFPMTGEKESLKDWQDERYSLGKQNGFSVPFTTSVSRRNNKYVGDFKFKPAIVEAALQNTDALRIKTCANCFKIFFAEPRNLNFCEPKCRDKKKSKTYYDQKKKNKN